VTEGARFELFVYVEDVDSNVERLRAAGSTVAAELPPPSHRYCD
jgi:hypothetical protein